jgi:flavin-dependent dehydrogenase
MRPDYDVVVVGARVAGASTAMLLARQGHRVLLVDRATMPSDTVSTHAILRTGVLQLTRWGLLDRVEGAGTPPVSHITLGFGDERIPFRVKDEYGVSHLYAPRRILLDRLLTEAAVEAGVEFVDGTALTDLVTSDGGRVTGVVLGRGQRSTRVTASMVVGADGFRSRLARLVDAPVEYQHEPANTVHYAYYTGVASDGFFFQFTPGVNAGFIQTDDGAVCAFAGRPSASSDRWADDPDRAFARLMARAGPDLAGLLAEGTRVSPFRGTSGLPGFIRRPWGPGWALVGDAGYTKDPISAHGISDALRDAELCARAVDRALLCPSEERRALADYQRVRDALSWPMFEQARALARFQWDAAEASARMRVISETVREECEAILTLPRWPAAPVAMSA